MLEKMDFVRSKTSMLFSLLTTAIRLTMINTIFCKQKHFNCNIQITGALFCLLLTYAQPILLYFM